MTSAYTDEQILDTIAVAIRRRDLDVVPGLIILLALQNPRLAQETLDGIRWALSAAGKGGTN